MRMILEIEYHCNFSTASYASLLAFVIIQSSGYYSIFGLINCFLYVQMHVGIQWSIRTLHPFYIVSVLAVNSPLFESVGTGYFLLASYLLSSDNIPISVHLSPKRMQIKNENLSGYSLMLFVLQRSLIRFLTICFWDHPMVSLCMWEVLF